MREFKAKEMEMQTGLTRLREGEKHEDDTGKRKVGAEDEGGVDMQVWVHEGDPDNRTQHQEGRGSEMARESEELGQEEESPVQKRRNEEAGQEQDGGKRVKSYEDRQGIRRKKED